MGDLLRRRQSAAPHPSANHRRECRRAARSPFERAESAAEFLEASGYQNVLRWAKEVAARPAVKRGRMVNRTFGEPNEQLHERHDASDFDTHTEDKRNG